MKLVSGQPDRPIIFREGAVCPEGYLCVPGLKPIKLPDVQADVEPTGPWWGDLITDEGGGWEPSSFFPGRTDEGDYIHNLPFVTIDPAFNVAQPGGWSGYSADTFRAHGWPWPERITPIPGDLTGLYPDYWGEGRGPPGYGYPVRDRHTEANVVGPYSIDPSLYPFA